MELAEEVVLDPEVDHHEEAEVPNEADAVDHTELLTPLPLTTYLQDASKSQENNIKDISQNNYVQFSITNWYKYRLQKV